LAVEDQDASLPVVLTPDKDLVIPCRRLAALRGLRPAMQALGDHGRAHGLRGICVTTRETVERGSTLHSRFFAPHVGIPEDPVTGSVHASLGVYAFAIGALPRSDGIHRFVAEQGDSLGRPGRLTVEITVAQGHPTRVRVGGQAVTVLEGTLFLPDL
jgi:PhzF family phenazine biosynthesis protein